MSDENEKPSPSFRHTRRDMLKFSAAATLSALGLGGPAGNIISEMPSGATAALIPEAAPALNPVLAGALHQVFEVRGEGTPLCSWVADFFLDEENHAKTGEDFEAELKTKLKETYAGLLKYADVARTIQNADKKDVAILDMLPEMQQALLRRGVPELWQLAKPELREWWDGASMAKKQRHFDEATYHDTSFLSNLDTEIRSSGLVDIPEKGCLTPQMRCAYFERLLDFAPKTQDEWDMAHRATHTIFELVGKTPGRVDEIDAEYNTALDALNDRAGLVGKWFMDIIPWQHPDAVSVPTGYVKNGGSRTYDLEFSLRDPPEKILGAFDELIFRLPDFLRDSIGYYREYCHASPHFAALEKDMPRIIEDLPQTVNEVKMEEEKRWRIEKLMRPHTEQRFEIMR